MAAMAAAQPTSGGARAVLLDAMGTLLTFAPPAPLLREALRERLGIEVGADAARAAIRAEIAHYRAHLHTGRDAAGVAELRRTSAEAMRPALGADVAGVATQDLAGALMASLRFAAFPDAAPALTALRAEGLRLVVVSNWDASLHERLDETGLAPLVDAAVASAELGSAKPEPAIFARALELAGVAAAAAWHVGDSPQADVAGARAAGVRAVLLDRSGGAGAGAPGAEAVIGSLDELPPLVAAVRQYP
jgi:putative hydrolase of the HAD superfamily